MSKLHILIPAKSFRQAKRRLANVLGPAEREALSARMLAHSLAMVRAAVGNQPITVVTNDAEVSQFALKHGADAAHAALAAGLNNELHHAATSITPETTVLVIHADLPELAIDDIRALLSAEAQVVIAPDHGGTGTNALLQRQADRFFAFGPDSCARHIEAAKRRGFGIARIERSGLAHDLDSAADWERLGQKQAAILQP